MTVHLPEDVREALIAMALAECRHPMDQAEWLLRAALVAYGWLPPPVPPARGAWPEAALEVK